MNVPEPPTAGTQHELLLTSGSGYVRAVISEVGASPRVLTVDGVDLVEPYPADRPPPMAAGAVLVPWPNRVDSGRWSLNGVDKQLEITEPDLGHAIHGLLSTARYDVTSRGARHVTLAADIDPCPGYPFRLSTRVSYELAPDGMWIRHEIRNDGAESAPVAVGSHPYLRVGDAAVQDLTVTIPAARALTLDERHIPTGSVDVEGTALDLRAGRRVGDAVAHASYADVEVVDGVVTHSLRAPDGRSVDLVADPDFAYVHFYVTDDYPGEHGRTSAVAIEPMTAPPNALRSGEGLRWLEPAQTWSLGWRLRLRP